MTVNPVNDAPAGTDSTVTTSEDTAYAFATTDFGFTDPSDSPANNLLAVKINTLPGAGTLKDNGVAVVAGQSVSAADITAGNLQFTSALNANGMGYASFTFQVRDDGGAANGGSDLDQSPNTMTLNVTPVNDAPTFVSTPVTRLTVDAPADSAQDRVFRVAGTPGTNSDVVFTLNARDSGKYETGVFLVDDASGRIGTLRPGDAGYADAALASARATTLFTSRSLLGDQTHVSLAAGQLYGTYLIVTPKRIGTPGQALAGPAPYGSAVFFSFEGANPEAYDQMHTQAVSGNFQLGWESTAHGGDASFNDLVFTAYGLASLATGNGQGSFSYAAQAADVDGDVLTYGLVTGPAGASIDAHTGQLGFAAAIGAYDFVIAVDDGQGGHAEQAFHLNVVARDTPNVVTALSATSSGFRVRFDHTVDPSLINLYDAADASFGAGDVRLTGAGGPVNGTLILDADRAGFTFVKTGMPLADGAYTVTLRSGNDAFKNLDGNADGTPGDNYASTFIVAGGSARVSISDLTRGPGQDVSDALSATFINTGTTKITSVRFNLRYDPHLLTLTGAMLAPGLPAGTKLSADFSTPGFARITLTATTALPTGSLKLVTFKASIPASAPYGAKQVLDITDVTVNGSTLAGDDDGVEIVAYVGDASGNAQYTTLDAQRIERVEKGLDSGFSAYRDVDPVLIADLNSSGSLETLNVSGIVSYPDRDILNQELQFLATGNAAFDRAEIPAIPPGVGPLTFSGPDPLVNLPTDLTAKAGDVMLVPVNVDTAVGLESVQLSIGYDPDMLEVIAVHQSILTAGFTGIFDTHTAGAVYVDMSGPALNDGSGALVALEVRVKDTASGAIVLDLRSAALNDGHLVLGQAPQTGADATDGRITVQPTQSVLAAIKATISGFVDKFEGMIWPQQTGPNFVAPAKLADSTTLDAAIRKAGPAIDLGGQLTSPTAGTQDSGDTRWKRRLAGVQADSDVQSKTLVNISIPVKPSVSKPGPRI